MNRNIISHFSFDPLPPRSRQIGEAIRCFECNSNNDTRCGDDKPPTDLSIECGDHQRGVKYTFCRKIKQFVEFSVNGRKYIDSIVCALDEYTLCHSYYNLASTPFCSYSATRYPSHSQLRLGGFGTIQK